MPEKENVFHCSSCKKLIAKGNIIDGSIAIKCKCGVVTTIESHPKSCKVELTNNGLPVQELVLGSFSIQHLSETSELL